MSDREVLRAKVDRCRVAYETWMEALGVREPNREELLTTYDVALVKPLVEALKRAPTHYEDCDWDWRNCSAANPSRCTCGWGAIREAALQAHGERVVQAK
jgi:hypothetical protein